MPFLSAWPTCIPKLFGAGFLPLKRHLPGPAGRPPRRFETPALKAAGFSHPFLALPGGFGGWAFLDLAGKAVDILAPEHVYQALVEVFRRRQPAVRRL